MGKGRKALPTAIKQLRGTDQPCRVNQHEVNPEKFTRLPSAPRFFTKTQKRIYRSKGDQLLKLGVITPMDLEIFISFCREYGNYIDTCDQLDNYTIDNTLDFLMKVDYSRIPMGKKSDVLDALAFTEDYMLRRMQKKNKESWERAKAIASEFGFTPAARTKIVVSAGDRDRDDKDFD